MDRNSPGQSIQLNASHFNGWAGNHFIMCCVSNGTGGLNLTIADGNGNVLAQSTAYLQVKDIKQMYERWTVGDNSTNPPASMPYLAVPAFQYTTPQDCNTTYMLHVHGYNMETWDNIVVAQTVVIMAIR